MSWDSLTKLFSPRDPEGIERNYSERGIRDLLGPMPSAEMKVGTPEVLKYGALEAPTLDLQHRPWVENADGSHSTVRSMGIRTGDSANDPNGKEVLIPTVSNEGWIMSDDQARDEYERTGQHMGVYPTQEASDRAGDLIHRDQERNPPTNTLDMRHVQLPELVIKGRKKRK